MSNTPQTTIPAIFEALKLAIAAAFPELKEVTAYDRLPERAAVPRVMLQVIEGLPTDGHGDLGTEQFSAEMGFSAYVLGDPRGGAAADIAVLDLAMRITAWLKDHHLGIPARVSQVRGCYPDFVAAGGRNASGHNAAGFVKAQRIDFSISALFRASVWDWPEEDVELIFEDGEPSDLGLS